VAEDYQLVLLERGTNTYVGTFDGHPYVAPFSGNVIELCPVGALTSRPYRFRARPWDIVGAGSVCTLCPSQCNVHLTVRDERVLRVLSRENPEVDDGWLCDKGRFAYQSMHVDERLTQPLVRDGGELRPVTWERALDEAAKGLGRARGRVGALAGGETTNEEAFLLQRLMREALDSPDLDSRAGGRLDGELARALAAPALQASVSDLEFAHAVLVLDCEPVDDAPILDLRLRKGARRNGVRLIVATSRPSSLDAGAAAVTRFAPGAGEALLTALDAALGGGGDLDALSGAAGADAGSIRELARVLRDTGRDVVILWGERLTHGPRAAQAARGLLSVADRLRLGEHDGAGLLEIPAHANGRGLREAGFLPTAGPGLGAAAQDGREAAAIAGALGDGELSAVYLIGVDPLRALPDRSSWEAALSKATTVVAHAGLLTEGIREHANVVFPAEAYAEKEGTVTHPDGRVQRLRPAIDRQGDNRAGWQVLADLAGRLGLDTGVLTGSMASQQLFDAVPFLTGLTLEELGGRGVRWPERPGASALAWGAGGPFTLETPPAGPSANGALRLATFRSIWAAPEVDASPALAFLAGRQRAQLAPDDARRLGIGNGDSVEVAPPGANGSGPRVRAVALIRDAVPAGTVVLEEGLAQDAANALTGADGSRLVEVRRA
jgi:NADH-quinone oxidoreductase subunit G